MKDILVKSYNRSSKSYDLQFKNIQQIKYNSIFLLLKNRNPKAFLDLGAGTGLFYQFLQEKSSPWAEFYHGIDLSEGMVEHAQFKKVPRIIVGDAEELPYTDSVFDVVISCTSLGLMEQNWHLIFSEVSRILTSGGCFILTILPSGFTEAIFDIAGEYKLAGVNTGTTGQDVIFVFNKV